MSSGGGRVGVPIPDSAAGYVSAASGNVANAPAVAAMPAVAGKTNWLTGFEITAAGATAALAVLATLAGLAGGTITYVFTFPAGATVGAPPLTVEFSSPMPAAAVNTAITLTLPAGGAGNTNAAVALHGYLI